MVAAQSNLAAAARLAGASSVPAVACHPWSPGSTSVLGLVHSPWGGHSAGQEWEAGFAELAWGPHPVTPDSRASRWNSRGVEFKPGSVSTLLHL